MLTWKNCSGQKVHATEGLLHSLRVFQMFFDVWIIYVKDRNVTDNRPNDMPK